jgi:predicted house-cleaning noncanonical NTP pyrophosphatase (MazG superfamily)
MKKYNKLVRDNIPEIIKANGEVPKTRKLNVAEYKKALLYKLLEEAKELTETKNKKDLIGELSDIQEILKAIHSAYKVKVSDVTKTAQKKRQKRGAFKNKIFLESVDQKTN